MNAIVNAAILSLPLTAAVWLALRLLPRRSLSASARYVIWWTALVTTVLLPLAYVPMHVSNAPIANVAPTVILDLPVLAVAAVTIRAVPSSPAGAKLRFPIRIATGAWTRAILIAWAAAAFLLLARLIVSCFALLRLKAGSRPFWIAIPFSRNARLMLSPEVPAPMAVGFLRPAILFPARYLDELSAEEIRQIALHESAHLIRRDDYALIVERALEAVFALHPAVRFIASQLDLEREIACDDRVLQATGQPKSYAACLTRVAEMSSQMAFPAAAFAQNVSQLGRRVDMLLDQTRRARTRLLKTRLAFAAATLFGIAWTLAKAPALLAFSAPAAQSMPSAPPQFQAPPQLQAPSRPAPALPRLLAQAPAPAQAFSPAFNQAAVNRPSAMVVLPVEVRTADGMKIVTGLSQYDFKVYENGIQQTISTFTFDDSPLAMAVVQAGGDPLKQETRDALKELVGHGGSFEYTQPADSSITGIGAEVDAVAGRLASLPNSRKLLVIVKSQPNSPGSTFPPPEFADFLADRAQFSGVKIVAANQLELESSPMGVRRLNLTMSYSIGYLPTNPALDGSFRNTRVAVDMPGLWVTTRQGYYANAR